MRKLVIVLHGYKLNLKKYDPVKAVIDSCYPGAVIYLPVMPLTALSTVDPNVIVAGLLKEVDARWKALWDEQPGEPPKIVIIGHSTGALLAKKLYICACGENSDAPFEDAISEKAQRPWAAHIERMVLLAGMNRGWTLNPHLYAKTMFLMRLGILFGKLIRLTGKEPLGFQTRKGAAFVTQIRIQWLSMIMQAKNKQAGDALVVQLLGTVDDIVSPEDNIDLVTGSNFIYLDVPNSGHVEVLAMDDRLAGRQRTEVFTNALTRSRAELEKIQVTPTDERNLVIDPTVTDVVFVIHGIRDTGYWTQKVARRVKATGDKLEGRKFAMETSTYGYFPMLPFLIYEARRAKVEWLMDQYTENRAQYPNAKFSFLGHSNGTYLLAKALKEYPACRFENVVFAGSVVSKDYNWEKLIVDKRIGKFYNFVATSDWVVALFPKSFQVMGIQDIGSAGFDGFVQLGDQQQLKFIPGKHGAAIEEKYWDEIVKFIVHGEFTEDFRTAHAVERAPVMRFLGAIAPLPFVCIIALLGVIGYEIWTHTTGDTGWKVLYECLYLLVVWRFITRI